MIQLILAGLVGWIIAAWYYRRSSKEMPEWVQPVIDELIEEFGEKAPSREQLIEHFNEAVEEGTLIPHVPSGYVACPSCEAPSSELEYIEANYPGRGDHARYSFVHCKVCNFKEFLGDL